LMNTVKRLYSHLLVLSAAPWVKIYWTRYHTRTKKPEHCSGLPYLGRGSIGIFM